MKSPSPRAWGTLRRHVPHTRPTRTFVTTYPRLSLIDRLRSIGRSSPQTAQRTNLAARSTPNELESPQFPRRLPLPPAKTTYAAKEKDVYDAEYSPAVSAEGLEHVGDLKTWWDQPDHWGPERQFRPFASLTRVTDPDVLLAIIRRAVVEALALRAAAAAKPKHYHGWAVHSWRIGGEAEMNEALAVRIVVNSDGSVSLDGSPGEPYSLLIKGKKDVARNKVEASPVGEVLSPEAAATIAKGWDPAWLEISLVDTELMFAIRKRICQLSAHFLSDSKLKLVTTPRQLYDALLVPPKAFTMAETLLRQEDKPNGLLGLPHVRVYDRRITPIDRDAWAGRWKVIEQELVSRSLPVTGHKHIPMRREAEWIRGSRRANNFR